MSFRSLRLPLLVLLLAAVAPACSSRSASTVDAGRPMGDGGDGDAGVPDHCANGTRDGDESALDCGGSCAPCASGMRCAVPGDCESGVCVGGYCLVPACDDGIRNGGETDVDCGGAECLACGGGSACSTGTDCLSGVCEGGACLASSCEDGVHNSMETDVDCGGPDCRPCRAMHHCAVDEDCESLVCIGELCSPSMCNDGIENGEETDVDCGGERCSGCPLGRSCLVDTDCYGNVCWEEVCISCADGVMNGEETAVDCGGPDCSGCADGSTCSVAEDCTSGVCTDGTCVAPSCTDGVQNADETDVDCGGTTCDRCADDAMCAAATDCESGVCTAGVCQAPACDDGVLNGGETDVDCGGSSTSCPACADYRRCTEASDCEADVCTMGRCGTFAGCLWGLVSDDTQLDVMGIHDALLTHGHTYEVHNDADTSMTLADSTFLSGYSFLVFNNYNRALTIAERDALQTWLNNGGSLVVTGYDTLGSPTDANMASVVNCTSPGDGPFSTALSVVNDTHPIMTGPARTFTAGATLTASSSDHDQCTPGTGAVRLIEVSGSSKLQITEGIGTGGGRVVWWNGTGHTEMAGTSGTQPDLQELFLNVLDYLCNAP